MRVQVLYFAAARDLVSIEEENVEVPGEVRTVADFVRWLPERHAPLAGRMTSIRIARNEAFADAGDVLAEGDVLALIPPVAGG